MTSSGAIATTQAVSRVRPTVVGAVAVMLLAAVVRVGVLVDKWSAPLLLNDSLWYSAQASVLADGDGFRDPFVGGPSAEHGPLTPVLLAPVSWMDDPVRWQRLVMTLLGLVTVALIGLLARRIAGQVAGVVAAGLAAVYPPLWMNDALVMSETPAVLLVVVVLHLAVGGVLGDDRLGRWRPVLLGVAIGLAALARSELLLLAPLVALVWWRERRHHLPEPGAADDQAPVEGGVPGVRATVMLFGVAALTIAPWVVPNLVRFERPVAMTTNDGTTLLGANCDDSWNGPDIGGWSLFCVLDAGGPPGEDPSVRSDRQRRAAVSHVVDNVERAPLVVAARVGRAIDLIGQRNLVAGDVGEERYRWASWAGIVGWWLLVVPAVLGLRAMAPGVRRYLLVPVVSVLFTTVVFYGGHRIRAPLEPTIVIGAATWLAARLTVGSSRPVTL